MLIQGGYYLKARAIQNSDIAKAPPHVREIWDWLLKEANYKDTKICKRGETIRSYSDIIEGLKWYVGWRKMTYTKHHCEIAMKWLKKATMITTRKTTRGIHITILNYDYYQSPDNYAIQESHTENHKKATRKPQTSDTIKNKDNKDKERKKEIIALKEKFFKNSLFDKIKEKYPFRDYEYYFYEMCDWYKENKNKLPKNISALSNWLSKTKPDQKLIQAYEKDKEKQKRDKIEKEVEENKASPETAKKLLDIERKKLKLTNKMSM